MHCVTDIEVEEWLYEREIPKDPYHHDSSPELYMQFHAPANHRRLDAFTRHYYERIIPESDSLVHMTDWGHYQESEMIAVLGIRSTHGDNRMLIDAPGHTLTWGQREIGISLFSLTASFAWTSYLYSAQNRSTLFNWEGEIFDFWTDDEEAIGEMKLVLKDFELAETK